MKKIIAIVLTLIIAVVMTACGASTEPQQKEFENTSTSTAAATESPTQASTETPESSSTEEEVYSFEFADIEGNIHKLSDYQGKPVYLRVWGSWCSVCMSSLDSLDELAGGELDFVLLSIVMPGMYGELSSDEFIDWYKDLGYDNLIVLFDDNSQIVNDFGINAFPSQIMFDAEGHVVYGVAGLMTSDQIKEAMEKVAQKSE